MDDGLKAARRVGAVRRLLWPRGRNRKGFMHGGRWMGAALVLLVCALTVFGIVLLNGERRTPPAGEEKRSEGVLALSDFLRTYSDNWEILSAGTLKGVERLMNEPFEISAQMTAESDALTDIGLPLAGLPASVDLKYDLRDLGVRVNAMGIDLFKACVTGGELITVQTDGSAKAAPLPASGDVSGDMTLGERISRFVPLPPKTLLTRLLGLLAGSVPHECTRMELGRALSPMEQKDVNVTLINTSLDSEALAETAAAFAAELQKDGGLYDEAKDWTADTAAWLGGSGVTLDELLRQLKNKESGCAAVAWKVYRRGGTPLGFSLDIQTADAKYGFTLLAEFGAEAGYEHMELTKDGGKLFGMDMTVKDGGGELYAEAARDGGPVSVKAVFRLDADTKDVFRFSADATVTGRLLTEKEDTLHVGADADIRFGSGLGLLASQNGWRDILERGHEK